MTAANRDLEMTLRHGIAWRQKIEARWRSLPWYSRLWWTLRGHNPHRDGTLA